MIKTYCYSKDCDIVDTGFRIEVYYVCKKCKQEVSKYLKDDVNQRKEEEARRKEEQDKKKKDSEPGLFEFLDYYGGD